VCDSAKCESFEVSCSKFSLFEGDELIIVEK